MEYDILIVDDQTTNIEIIVNCFEEYKEPYNVLRAPNGEIAYKIAIIKQPDVIITDWDMPVSNGIELIRNLKRNPKTDEIPVFMTTGVMTTTENLATALDAGALDFIRKPIDKLELISRTRAMLKLAITYKEMISHKNRELASLAMNVFRNNEFNRKLIEKLKAIDLNFGTKNKRLSTELINLHTEIEEVSRNEAWQQYEDYFKVVHPEFATKLLSKHPDLSPAEMKLCYFLRLNMSTKNIADITFQNHDSIKIARSRLKKKLNVEHINNLTSYLLSL